MTTITTIGRVTKDFELRTSEKNGSAYANFSLAVNEGFGEKQKTMFFECVVFGSDAERLVKAKVKKGSLIQVTGKLGVSEFTRNNGEPGYSLRITILAWNYIPVASSQKENNGSNGNGSGNESDIGDNGGNVQTSNPKTQQSENDFNGEINLDDDDLPF